LKEACVRLMGDSSHTYALVIYLMDTQH